MLKVLLICVKLLVLEIKINEIDKTQLKVGESGYKVG